MKNRIRSLVRTRPSVATIAVALAVALLGSACSSTVKQAPPVETSTPPTSAPEIPGDATAEPSSADEVADTATPISTVGLAAARHQGDRLRLGSIREETADYVSYDVTFRSRSTYPGQKAESYQISGVLNLPRGPGPFPAAVLAHGYIDPAIYERGQGMTRERGYLASRGYVALHVDYRNHAESDNDPRSPIRVRQGYTADVINGVKALLASGRVPVQKDQVVLFGRSMGGGVILKALAAEPGLVQAAAPWASVSSLEAENYEQFIADDPEDAGRRNEIAQRHGTPEESPGFWRSVSSRPLFDQITEPVLLVHGRFDDTCPPRWAQASQRALREAGVDSRLRFYDDAHAFGPAFNSAMDDTIAFFDQQLGR